MAIIKIKKVRSEIRKPANQKKTLLALGLKKIGQVVEHQDTPNIVGMINKVKHLVTVIK
jgi:large subunit ribosomal protein L30